jgi:uncharacterized protein DUF4440
MLRSLEAARGKDLRTHASHRDFSEYNCYVDVTNEEIIIEGGHASARGNYIVTLTPKFGGDAQVIRRRFLEIWRREGGVWRAFRAMDNVGNPETNATLAFHAIRRSSV